MGQPTSGPNTSNAVVGLESNLVFIAGKWYYSFPCGTLVELDILFAEDADEPQVAD